jgi:hypothetical protein
MAIMDIEAKMLWRKMLAFCPSPYVRTRPQVHRAARIQSCGTIAGSSAAFRSARTKTDDLPRISNA